MKGLDTVESLSVEVKDSKVTNFNVLVIFLSTILDDKVDNKIDEIASDTVKCDTFGPLTSTERLSTVSSPFMVTLCFLKIYRKNTKMVTIQTCR